MPRDERHARTRHRADVLSPQASAVRRTAPSQRGGRVARTNVVRRSTATWCRSTTISASLERSRRPRSTRRARTRRTRRQKPHAGPRMVPTRVAHATTNMRRTRPDEHSARAGEPRRDRNPVSVGSNACTKHNTQCPGTSIVITMTPLPPMRMGIRRGRHGRQMRCARAFREGGLSVREHEKSRKRNTAERGWS